MTIFTANISKAAETRYVEKLGTTVTDFNVAENYQGRNGDRLTQFYRVSIWGERGAKLKEYLTLGRSITLTGRVKGRAYLDKNGVPQCTLEMANPQVSFNTANPTQEVDAVTEVPEEAGDEDKPF